MIGRSFCGEKFFGVHIFLELVFTIFGQNSSKIIEIGSIAKNGFHKIIIIIIIIIINIPVCVAVTVEQLYNKS